ncbi:MAG: hypothetical protein IKU18_06270, partial [Bacteroidales bacterium]|nr:hypothetical protein [Bacteroidales bacterium]
RKAGSRTRREPLIKEVAANLQRIIRNGYPLFLCYLLEGIWRGKVWQMICRSFLSVYDILSGVS